MHVEILGGYIALVRGGTILGVGIYLERSGTGAAGMTLAGRMGIGGGGPITITGWGYIVIGPMFFVPALL
jgi:hypothetical protein